MSNQQGYPGQPPYGPPQQPYGQPGPPQYGGYPPPPPPPAPKSGKTGLVVFCVVVVLIVIGSGIFVVTRFTGGSDDAATTQPVAAQPSSKVATASPSAGGSPSTGVSPSSPPSLPASPSARPSAPPAVCNGCFPGITVKQAVSRLKALNFVCKEDRVLGIQCERGKLEVGIDRDYTQKNYIENIDVGGRASGKGDYPQGPREAFATLNAGLPWVLPLFIADASVRQQIITFTAKNAGHADNGPSTLMSGKAGNYRLSCHGVSGATVGNGSRSASSYSTSVNIYGPSAY